MNTKHTPGPWKQQADRNGYTRGISGHHGPEVVNVVNWNGISRPTTQIGAANARLIAAAPCLLEALKSMLGLAAAFGAAQNGDEWQEVIQARAAIAKATGETI